MKKTKINISEKSTIDKIYPSFFETEFTFEPVDVEQGDIFYVIGNELVFERNGKEFARRKLTTKEAVER